MTQHSISRQIKCVATALVTGLFVVSTANLAHAQKGGGRNGDQPVVRNHSGDPPRPVICGGNGGGGRNCPPGSVQGPRVPGTGWGTNVSDHR